VFICQNWVLLIRPVAEGYLVGFSLGGVNALKLFFFGTVTAE